MQTQSKLGSQYAFEKNPRSLLNFYFPRQADVKQADMYVQEVELPCSRCPQRKTFQHDFTPLMLSKYVVE